MTAITHKQARSYLRAAADGLIHEEQRALLDAHLLECVSCRTEADELNALETRLKKNFQAKWDAYDGPSRNVPTNIHSQSRRIIMTNQINTTLRTVAGIAALIILGLVANFAISQLRNNSLAANGVENAGSVNPSNDVVGEDPTALPSSRTNSLIAFTSDIDGNLDIYTMYADGSGLTNLTDNPARDANPVWSPDGKRIAFESDRDGGNPSQIFLMDADGSNTTPLTTDDGDHMLPSTTNSKTSLWSPDGNKLLYMRIGRSDTEWTLQSIDLNTGDITSLGTGKVDINHILWSPDGKHIAFIHNDPANTDDNKYIAQMQIVRADGSNLTTITMPSEEGLNVPINYYWSGDGQSVFLIASNMYAENTASENYTWKVYEANLDGTLTLQTTTHSPIGGWWNGTYFLAGSALGSSSPAFTWVQQKGKMTSVNPLQNCQELLDSNTGGYASGRSSYKQSANGNLVIGGYCPNGDMWLFWANSKGTVRQLLNLQSVAAPDTTGALAWAPNDFAWSQDDKYIAFSISSLGKTNLYIVNVGESLKDPSIQPVRMTIGDGSLYYSPSWHSFVP